MAGSKFSVRVLAVVIVISWSLSTCSFQNNSLWTTPDDEKSLEVALPHFCSQANSLHSPAVVKLFVPSPADKSDPESLLQSPPTVSKLPSTYIGSRSTNLYSPIPPAYISISLFDRLLSLVNLILLTAGVMLLTVWICHLLPLLSYIMISSICETLSLSPRILLDTMRKKD